MGPRRPRGAGRRDGATAALGTPRGVAEPAEGGARLRAVTEASAQGRFAALAREDARGALVTVLEGPGLGSKLLVLPDGTRSGSLGSPELDEEGARHADELMWAERSEQREEGGVMLFVDATFPSPRLIVFGA